jgi:hypothetical protein
MVHGKLTADMRRILLGVFAICALLLSTAWGATSALAAVPAWSVKSYVPSDLVPGSNGEVVVRATNLGDANADSSLGPAVITDTLPPGVTATAMEGRATYSPASLSCDVASLTCELSGLLFSYGTIEINIKVEVEQDAPASGMNISKIVGGGAAPASSSESISLRSTPGSFGVEKFEQVALNENGSIDTQAGSHPFQLTTTIGLSGTHLGKDLHFDLPPGVIGNPTVVPQCTAEQFSTLVNGVFDICPDDTVIGVATIDLSVFGIITVPLFNLVPAVGEPAKFGFEFLDVPIILDTSVRSGGDYGVVVSVNNISQTFHFFNSQVTFWGVPGSPSHNNARGWKCLDGGWYAEHEYGPCPESNGGVAEAPFLTLPTSCAGPLKSTVEADSWAAPGDFSAALQSTVSEGGHPLGMTGCNKLRFEPSITDAPDGQAASTPTGLAVGVHIPQEITLNPQGLAEADLKTTTVTLPEGVGLNAAAADGLQACSEEEIGYEGINPQTQIREFTDAEQTCPEASKLGTVKVQTPLLPNPLKGAAYLATQDTNPFGSLIAMYIVAKDPVSGVLVKFAGQVTPNAVTGQLVTTFENTPQLPFEELELHFFGTARAPLSTPAACGAYTTQASFAPWSGNPPAEPTSTFDVVSGPNGGPCESPLPFAPTLTAGTSSIQAGGFSPFTMTMSREDGNQNLKAIQLHMPPGLLGTLSTVKLCGEPQADEGTCGPESLIGNTTISVGLGGDPYTVQGGQVFITGPYEGAPYGLSIVNPAVAGPFDLGKVIVRAKIEVDPTTAALTITTDGSGPYKIPTILDGIPLEIKHVNVVINRPGFTFNATNCSPLAVTGTLESSDGASSQLSVPYQITNCAVLAFKPKLTASTSGKTSRANGASLSVGLTYPAGPFDANIAKVKVELPKALPSRLKTLQKACLARVFAANPAACPPTSIVGHAKAVTPVLPVPLEGPAYFVSNGGEAFPNLVVVLQGYGATVDLVGSTFISTTGITSSTFKTVPDVPVGTFELNLPEGPYSALAAAKDFCRTKLVMPTEFIGQNGAALYEQTPIGVTGCGKALTSTQKLAAALKACRRKGRHVKKCEKTAEAKYGRRGKGAIRK